jgi:DHA1 family purine ribonucleoside efflux pump-like MFS transporter
MPSYCHRRLDILTTSTTSTETPTVPEQASWAGVVSLSLGIFALVLAEFLPVSLLPLIAEDLGVSVGSAGQSVTVTAAAGLAALLVPVALPRADRRRVMIGLTALAVTSSLLVAVAPNLPVVLAARLLPGVALGGFWALAMAMAANLVPADHLGRALTVVNSGVAAVPLGAWLGEI